jgi:hypothetical protein
MHFRTLALALAFLPLLPACASEDATVEAHFYDAPPADVAAVRLTIAALQVHVAASGDKSDDSAGIDTDGRWTVLTVGHEIDVASLQGEANASHLGVTALPPGKITQIRLLLDTSKPEFNRVVRKDGTICNLDVSKVSKNGIKINHPFKAFDAAATGHHELWVEMPLDEALKAGKTGECYTLEPVLKLKKVKRDGAVVVIL